MDLHVLRHLNQDAVGPPIPLIRKRITIGSLESCDLILKLPDVLDKHCELTYADDQWLIVNLQTVNCLKINGNPVTEVQVLRPGDEIAIGEHILVYE
jgi:pSer/pThr/pTyr-binding forkhead associated (FHA) protein